MWVILEPDSLLQPPHEWSTYGRSSTRNDQLNWSWVPRLQKPHGLLNVSCYLERLNLRTTWWGFDALLFHFLISVKVRGDLWRFLTNFGRPFSLFSAPSTPLPAFLLTSSILITPFHHYSALISYPNSLWSSPLLWSPPPLDLMLLFSFLNSYPLSLPHKHANMKIRIRDPHRTEKVVFVFLSLGYFR